VVLTDYSLPGASGLDLLRHLREARKDTPVVLMTGVGDETIAVAALQQGAADYVVKQLGFERTLPVVIDRVLRRREREVEEERSRRRAAARSARLERQIEDQTELLRAALRESEALRRVGHALAGTRELKAALALVTQAAVDILRAKAAAILIRAGDELVLTSLRGMLKEAPGTKSADLVARLGTGYAQTVVAPLRGEDGEIGLLWVARARRTPFSAHERELLETIADIAALGIVNVRMHEQMRRQAAAAPADPERPADPASPEPDRPPEPAAAPDPAPPSPPAATKPERIDPGTLTVPSFPPALGRILALADDENGTPEALEEAVGLDPVLAARAIQQASTAALGRARAAASIREAIMVLGVRGVRNLAFAQFAYGLFARRSPADDLLCERALGAAAGAQVVLESQDPADAEDGYLCGLLHDVGAVALTGTYPERYRRVVQTVVDTGRPFAEVEKEIFGFSATRVMRDLLGRWHLPARVERALDAMASESRESELFDVAVRWAAAEALRTSPTWAKLLGTRAQPDWLTAELAALESELALPATELERLRALAAE